MPEDYSRSRAKNSNDYGDDRGEPYGRPGGGGGGGNRVMQIALVAVAVVVVVVAVILVKSLLGSSATNGPGPSATLALTDTTAPDETATPDDTSVITPTDTPADTSDVTPTDTPADTSDVTPTDTPADTSQPDDTASPAPTNTPKPTSTPSSGSTTGKALTVPAIDATTANVTSYLPLRASPSATATMLVKIPKDDKFTVLAVSTTKTWLKVKYSGKIGYVLAKYVAIGEGGTDKVCTVTSTTVNVRSGAGKTKDLVGTLKAGDTVVVTDTEKDSSGATWYKITVGDITGYVDSKYVRLESN